MLFPAGAIAPKPKCRGSQMKFDRYSSGGVILCGANWSMQGSHLQGFRPMWFFTMSLSEQKRTPKRMFSFETCRLPQVSNGLLVYVIFLLLYIGHDNHVPRVVQHEFTNSKHTMLYNYRSSPFRFFSSVDLALIFAPRAVNRPAPLLISSSHVYLHSIHHCSFIRGAW